VSEQSVQHHYVAAITVLCCSDRHAQGLILGFAGTAHSPNFCVHIVRKYNLSTSTTVTSGVAVIASDCLCSTIKKNLILSNVTYEVSNYALRDMVLAIL